MKICKIFKFDAAHKLCLPYSSKCNFTHGHSYKLEIEIEGPATQNGMVLDFVKLKEIINPLIDKFDHSYLNDYFEQPTAEIMVDWIWNEICYDFPNHTKLSRVKLWETESSYAEKIV